MDSTQASPTKKTKKNGKQKAYGRQWDRVILDFLKKAGLNEARIGFEADILVMNNAWEAEKVPLAIGELMRDLMTLGQYKPGHNLPERELDERKLDYVNGHVSEDGDMTSEPQSRSTINRSISQFLTRNRARNDHSNIEEFLLPPQSRKRPRSPSSDPSTSNAEPGPSCARTAARPVNRDLQMKYDIAKNESGPLNRTMRSGGSVSEARDAPGQGKGGIKVRKATSEETMERYPGLEERFQNIEDHFAVSYVPAPPESIFVRIKALEDHIITLERDYPPWAALHFNQPRRGWPPPPSRPIPIIIPSHLTALPPEPAPSTSTPTSSGSTPSPRTGTGKGKSGSSLHRAVMEKLQIQKALGGLKEGVE